MDILLLLFRVTANHNQTLISAKRITANHNQTLISASQTVRMAG
jgi:hypothetical protein